MRINNKKFPIESYKEKEKKFTNEMGESISKLNVIESNIDNLIKEDTKKMKENKEYQKFSS